MQGKRGFGFWKLKFNLPFLNISLVFAIVFTLLSFYALSRILTLPPHTSAWRINFIILQLTFSGVILTFLVAISLLLRRSLGALPRVEATLEKIIAGDHALRISIRKKDILHPLVDKMNKIIELLEAKEKTRA